MKRKAAMPAPAPSTPADRPAALSAMGSSPEQAERSKKVQEITRKSKGRFDDLDKSDQAFLNDLTSGHGRQMLELQWNSLKQQGGSPPQGDDPETKIREVIERTQGDYSKLTAYEKTQLDNFATGHGQQYFESRVKQWKESSQNKAKAGGSKAPAPAAPNK